MEQGWIEFTGLTFCNMRLEEYYLPGREITQDMLYHMFASGLFEMVKVKRPHDERYTEYNRAAQMRFTQERDRLEIRKLQAELANERAGKKVPK